MNQIKDLTQGNIFTQIIQLAIPIIATSFVQMAYNMTDIAWLGHVGSETVGAVGMAMYLVWFGSSILLIPKIGAEVGISQSIGQKNQKKAQDFAQNTFTLTFVIGITYALMVGIFAVPIIHAFNADSDSVNQTGISYLRIICVGMPFMFANLTMSGIYNGVGNTRIPFLINTIGLVVNIILDPLLIFGLGFIPAMGATGAGIATVFSQGTVFVIFMIFLYRKRNPLGIDNYFGNINKAYIKPILKLGGPMALQSVCFAFFAMILARVMIKISHGAATPFSVQSIGAQIEALSWMTAAGFSTALASFVGQNYGAGRWDRIQKGFFITLGIATFIGLISTVLFLFLGAEIFGLFVNSSEQHVLSLGIVYLIILSFSQIFMCLEITTTGAFNGVGKTIPPAITGILGNALRIPFAFLFSYSLIGWFPDFHNYISADTVAVTGVWWGISFSSVLKGTSLFFWFLIILNRIPERVQPLPLQRYWVRLIPSRILQSIFIKKYNDITPK